MTQCSRRTLCLGETLPTAHVQGWRSRHGDVGPHTRGDRVQGEWRRQLAGGMRFCEGVGCAAAAALAFAVNRGVRLRGAAGSRRCPRCAHNGWESEGVMLHNKTAISFLMECRVSSLRTAHRLNGAISCNPSCSGCSGPFFTCGSARSREAQCASASSWRKSGGRVHFTMGMNRLPVGKPAVYTMTAWPALCSILCVRRIDPTCQ